MRVADSVEIKEMDLINKLAKIRAISDVVRKEKSGYNYSYADITTILANITAGMKKYNVSLQPSIVHGTETVTPISTETTKFKKTGEPYINKTNEMLVTAEMNFRWINNDNLDQYIDVPWFVVGSQSDPSQAFGSGLTYTMRQFLTAFFQIAQSDTDVDAYRSKQKAAEVAEDKKVAEEIIKEFDTMCRKYLAANPDSSDEVKKFISRYASKGNYLSIKDPELASTLYDDFGKKFLGGEEKSE